MKGYFVQTDKINRLQCESIERLVKRARHAHWTNIDMRINGQNEHFEADWIKHMLAVPEVDDVTAMQMELAALRKRVEQFERYFAHESGRPQPQQAELGARARPATGGREG
jgi:hypothetical protein